jgi:hypothetical protein
MLYFTTREGQHILVLEPEHFKFLKDGEFLKSPDKAVLLAYSPDAEWLGEQMIANAENLTPALISKLIAESQKRPEKKNIPYHPAVHVIKDGKFVKND